MRQYYVYVMTNRSGSSLYTGVTNDLERRVYEHKNSLLPGFTSQYKINRLLYFEETSDVHAAIAREKQIKGWTRKRKIELVTSMNQEWLDLSEGWFAKSDSSASASE